MGKADVYESDYLENGEIFADLVNGVLYQGRQVVKAHELSEQDGELRSISGDNVKKTIRDKVRLWNGMVLAVLAVENQTRVDYRMVTRAMLMESMAYDKQWKKLREKMEVQRENVTSDEFFSGMRKEDKFIPVITIVIYYGREKTWDGARTLFELLDMKGKQKQIMPYISDYHLNLFDFHEHDNFEQFHSELKPFFEFLRYSGEKELLKEKMEANREQYEELSSQAKILLTKLTNIKKIPGVEAGRFERGEFSMCKAFEDMKEEGKIEGRLEGRSEGRIEGRLEGRAEEIVESGYEFQLSEEEVLKRLRNKLDVSEKDAHRFFDMFRKPAV